MIYDTFDVDGDGKISYSDWHKSVGPEIHPGESLYFRQDKSNINQYFSIDDQKKVNTNACKQYQCWQQTCGNGSYCALHNKMHKDSVTKFYESLYMKLTKD